MSTAPATTPAFIASVDDALGDRTTRFFGEGFKRVTHSLSEIVVDPRAQDSAISAVAAVGMPASWSRKGDTDQRPHLSTIDAMVLAARLAGLHAAHAGGPSSEHSFAVRSMSIKAGRAPDEEDLERIPVMGSVTASAATDQGHHTVLDCRIGSMAVVVGADHSAGTDGPAGAGTYDLESDLPGPWIDAPFGVSHHERSQHLSEVVADVGALSASAWLALDPEPDPAGPGGAPTMIDLFVSALQLGQVLLYALDGVSRAESNTLWMRSTQIVPRASQDAGDQRFRTVLERTQLLPTPAGTWRSARIGAELGGFALTCNVTHLLPAQ